MQRKKKSENDYLCQLRTSMKVVKGLRNKSYKGKFKQRNRIISQEKGLTVPTVQEPYRKIMTRCSLDLEKT